MYIPKSTVMDSVNGRLRACLFALGMHRLFTFGFVPREFSQLFSRHNKRNAIFLRPFDFKVKLKNKIKKWVIISIIVINFDHLLLQINQPRSTVMDSVNGRLRSYTAPYTTVFSPYTVENDRIFIKYGRYDCLSRLLYPSACPYPHPHTPHTLTLTLVLFFRWVPSDYTKLMKII
jgi:hypothetical protein